VARMVGHVTYLSAQSIGDKFGRRLQSADDIRYTVTEPEFQVESYLRHQGDAFVKRFDANTYLYTSRALTYFDLARQYGHGNLADALRGVRARTLLIENFTRTPMDGRPPSYCGVRTGGFLFVHYAGGTEELYDERHDPYELRNLARSPENAAVEDHLRRETQRLCTPPPPGFTF